MTYKTNEAYIESQVCYAEVVHVFESQEDLPNVDAHLVLRQITSLGQGRQQLPTTTPEGLQSRKMQVQNLFRECDLHIKNKKRKKWKYKREQGRLCIVRENEKDCIIKKIVFSI